jgi:hypothetical protein
LAAWWACSEVSEHAWRSGGARWRRGGDLFTWGRSRDNLEGVGQAAAEVPAFEESPDITGQGGQL